MAEQRTRVFESVTQGAGILTRNEAREQLGYDQYLTDSLLVPALMPLNVAGDEAQKV